MTKMKQARYVIFVGPQKQGASGPSYIALDGCPTILISKAARFHSVADAKDFAEVSRVALNGHTRIGLEDFTDLDLTG